MSGKEKIKNQGQTAERGRRLTQAEFESLIFKGIKKPHLSRNNIFERDSSLRSSYGRFVQDGGVDDMEKRQFNKMKANRLKEITPSSYDYSSISDYDCRSMRNDHLLVIQKGRSNNFLVVDDNFFKQFGLQKHEALVYADDVSGGGTSSEIVSLAVWMKNGKIYATDCVEESHSVRTGDILGGPNSMHYESGFKMRRVNIANEIVGEGVRLSVISTSPIASGLRKLFG